MRKGGARVNTHAPVHPRSRLLLAAVVPALVTVMGALILLPVTTPESEGRVPLLLWLVVIVLGAPIAAFMVNGRWPAATSMKRAILAALPQVFVLPLALRLVVWLEVKSGNLRPDTSEAEMSYGIVTVFGVLIGLVLVVLVAVAGNQATLRADRQSAAIADHP